MRPNWIILSLTALLLLSLLPEKASSCSCARRTPCEAFADSTAVFIGRMVNGSERVETGSRSGAAASIEAGTVRFEVEETFKGALGSEVGISVNSNKGTSCGPYGLIRGERYLVYAYGIPTSLSTGVCTRTELLSRAGEDLAFLRNLPETGSGGTLSGSVWFDKNDGRATPASSVTLVVRDAESRETRVLTNDQGMFELTNLKAGKYVVEALWPEHYASDRSKQQVTISDRGCTQLGFEAKLNGRLTGRVFDSNNRPASVMLHLLDARSQDDKRAILGHSDKDGRFEIRGVPPGRYVLYFDLLTDGWKHNQKYFYPGVTSRDEATMITIGLGEKGSGYEFQVPVEYVVQFVEGWVAWPDGAPAAGVEVMLLCPKSPRPDGINLEFAPPHTSTDNQGRFRLQGFKGHNYWIEARGTRSPGSEGQGEGRHSPAQELTLKRDLINVKLVLSATGFAGGCGK
jgi:prealbumin domain-containing protein